MSIFSYIYFHTFVGVFNVVDILWRVSADPGLIRE